MNKMVKEDIVKEECKKIYQWTKGNVELKEKIALF